MMLRRTPLLLLLGLAGCGSPQGASDTPSLGAVVVPDGPSLNRDTESFEVAGIVVIHKNTPGNATVAVDVFVDGGVALSSMDTAGAERLAIDVATTGGPADMEKVDYSARMAAMGSSIGGSFGYDYAVLSMDCILPYFDATWALFADTLRAPAWRASDLELRRELALSSLRSELDDPDSAVGVLAKDAAFAGHPYAVRPQGWEQTVSGLGLADLEAAWSSMLVRDRLTVVVVGNVERAVVERLVEDAFGALPASGPEPFGAVAVGDVSIDGPSVEVTARPELPTNYVLGYFAGPPVGDPDYPALQAALEILSDRLFEEVRTKRNLSYAVASGISDRRAVTGYLYVTTVDPDTALRVMFDTVDGMIDPPIGPQDLHDQIAGYLTRYYSGLQSNGAQASLLGRWQLIAGDREAADLHLARLQAVTPVDISRVLDRYVRNIRFVVIGDPEAVDPALFTSR